MDTIVEGRPGWTRIPRLLVSLSVVRRHSQLKLKTHTHSAPQARLWAYSELSPFSYHQTRIHYVSSYGFPISTPQQANYLELENGKRLYYPEDILPVEPANSPADTILILLPFFIYDAVSGQDNDWTPTVVGGVLTLGGVGPLSCTYLVGNALQDDAAAPQGPLRAEIRRARGQ
jgi:hypothetical protein